MVLTCRRLRNSISFIGKVKYAFGIMWYVLPHFIVENRSVTDMEKYSGVWDPNTVSVSKPNCPLTQLV